MALRRGSLAPSPARTKEARDHEAHCPGYVQVQGSSLQQSVSGPLSCLTGVFLMGTHRVILQIAWERPHHPGSF